MYGFGQNYPSSLVGRQQLLPSSKAAPSAHRDSVYLAGQVITTGGMELVANKRIDLGPLTLNQRGCAGTLTKIAGAANHR